MRESARGQNFRYGNYFHCKAEPKKLFDVYPYLGKPYFHGRLTEKVNTTRNFMRSGAGLNTGILISYKLEAITFNNMTL